MTFSFRQPEELCSWMRVGLLEAHQGKLRPAIYNIYGLEGRAEVCVHEGYLFGLYASEGFLSDATKFAIGIAEGRNLYPYLQQLEPSELNRLLPFLCNDDIQQLLLHKQYHIIRMYLALSPTKRDIPVAALEEPFLTELFLDAGWYLDLYTILHCYKSDSNGTRRESIKKLLERQKFERDSIHNEVLQNFHQTTVERGDFLIRKLLFLHK